MIESDPRAALLDFVRGRGRHGQSTFAVQTLPSHRDLCHHINPNLTPVWAPPSRPPIYFRATFSSTCSPASNPIRPFPQIHGQKRSLAANLTTFMSWVSPLPNCAHRPLKIHPSNLFITHPSPSQTTTWGLQKKG